MFDIVFGANFSDEISPSVGTLKELSTGGDNLLSSLHMSLEG